MDRATETGWEGEWDLADVAALSIIPTGQSGQPFLPHWGDQTALWASGEYKPMARALTSGEGSRSSP